MWRLTDLDVGVAPTCSTVSPAMRLGSASGIRVAEPASFGESFVGVPSRVGLSFKFGGSSISGSESVFLHFVSRVL